MFTSSNVSKLNVYLWPYFHVLPICTVHILLYMLFSTKVKKQVKLSHQKCSGSPRLKVAGFSLSQNELIIVRMLSSVLTNLLM